MIPDLLLALTLIAPVPLVPPDVAALPADPHPGQNLRRLHPRQFWGELVGVDLGTRTIVFRRESDDRVLAVRLLPYAEALRTFTPGVPLELFVPGERIVVGVADETEGRYGTIVRDEVHINYQHNLWYRIETLDAGALTARQIAANENVVHPDGHLMVMPAAPDGVLRWTLDARTVYWRGGAQAPVSELAVGDHVQIRSRMTGRGRQLIAWEIIDPPSMPLRDAEMRAAADRAVARDGVPVTLVSRQGGEAKLEILNGFARHTAGWGDGTALTLRVPGRPPAAVSLAAAPQEKDGRRTVTVKGPVEALAALSPAGTFHLAP